jgi:4-hydroxybenzoate polyprenyltransferase
LTNAAALTFLPVGIVGLITSLVGFIKFVQAGSLVGLVVCLAIIPVLYAILRTVFGRISESESARLQQVVEDLARLTEGSESP